MPFTSSGRIARPAPRRIEAPKRTLPSPGPRAPRSFPTKLAAPPKPITGKVGHANFEFDIAANVIRLLGRSVALQPAETHVLRILLNNRGQTTNARALARARLGGREIASAAVIHDALASLGKKLAGTGLEIKTNQRVGFEIHAFKVPELNRRLSDKILLAMNQALESGNKAIIEQLHVALELAKESERHWLKSRKAREKRALADGK